uniref:Elongation of very long chain fatty acids protein n=1 Tax=Parascaris equorum TaxID=6256 RepID=A0A914S1L6_PAREQ
MSNREPFQLKRPLLLWNTFLAVFSFFGFIRTAEKYKASFIKADFIYGTLISDNMVELGDTYFIVLKKKPLTFLHCYHHIVVLIGTIHGGAAHSAHGRFFITMNYFVHCIMYSYFAYTSYGWRPSRSMSMLVTTLQIAQMLIGITINSLVHQIKLYETAPCQQTMGHVYLGYFIYGSFAALFIHFYINAYYLSPRSKHRKTE